METLTMNWHSSFASGSSTMRSSIRASPTPQCPAELTMVVALPVSVHRTTPPALHTALVARTHIPSRSTSSRLVTIKSLHPSSTTPHSPRSSPTTITITTLSKRASMVAGEILVHVPNYQGACSIAESERWPVSLALPKQFHHRRRKGARMKELVQCKYLRCDVMRQIRQ
jgi:hypothetical protein